MCQRAATTLLLLFVMARPLSACLLEFANLMPGTDPGDLVSQTYQQLWDELAPQASPELLQKVAKGGDPFTIPESKEADLGTLRTKLEQFREMVREKGWEETSVPILVNLVQRRAGEREGSVDRRNIAVHTERGNFLVPFPSSTKASFSPDQRYAVSSNMTLPVKEGAAWTLNVLDLYTGTTSEIPGGKGYQIGPFFSSDGKYLLFADPGMTFTRVPFEEGKVDWAKATRVGEPDGDKTLGRVRMGTASKFFASVGNGGIWRFDLKMEKRVQADLTPLLKGSELAFWDVTPGTNRLELALRNPDTGRLAFQLAEMKSDGTVKLVKTDKLGRSFSRPSEHDDLKLVSVLRVDEDRSLFLLGEKPPMIYFVYRKHMMPEVPFDGRFGARGVSIPAIAKHPQRNEAVAVFRDAVENRCWGNVFDGLTGRLKGTIDLPLFTFDLQFAADGERVIARTSDGKVGVLRYNVKPLRN